ncbi:MAG: histidine--tRNA ligase [Epsilonproteobacteria bacterium]|nr:histidine--tRNA ligase [Campylobacterota bacterium]MBD3839044.1 histidine--tRNA ligase [Campylobacterota bacterium]
MINALRGMKDVTFEESKRFIYIIETASKIAQNYGYGYIETPILEETKLFKRSVGESSDIVGKEMYQFIDKGENDVCMRPEGTAGVVRAFVQAKLDRVQNQKNRFYYYGAMFRYEKPQKGRLREFHQFGCESFGESSVYEDFTIISMIGEIFKALGIRYKLKINSLGCVECMPTYKESLINFLTPIKEELCSDCQRRIDTNPIRVLDCKNPHCQELITDSPKLTFNLCSSCDSDFEKLKSLLNSGNVNYEIDTNLVRGLDYYNKTAFEFVSDEIGSQSAIAGGGRYDRLVEFLDGKSTPAVGFALGIERIWELVKMPISTREGYYFGAMNQEGVEILLILAQKTRLTQKVTVEYAPKKLQAHLKNADKANAQYLLFLGIDELKEGKVWIKNLETKEETIRLMEDF